MAPRARPCVLLAAAVLLAAVHSGSLEWTCSCFAEDLGENRAPAPLNFNGFLSCSLEKKTAMNSERKNHDGALKPTVGSIESHELLFSHPSKKWSHVYVLYFWEAIHKQLPCLNSHHNPFQSSMVKQTFPKIILPPSTTFKIWSPKHRNMHDDMMISLDWVPEIIPSTSSNLCSLLLKLPQLIKNGSGLPLSDFSGCPQLRS